VIDPWGGSYYVEALTHELMHRAWGHIMEAEEMGGMSKAVEAGIPKMRIEEAAARRQARIDSGEETIVGVNKYRLAKEDPLDILDVDNTAVREPDRAAQETPRRTRRSRLPGHPQALTECAGGGEGQPARPRHRGRPGPRLARRDFRRHGKTLRPLQGHHPLDLRRLRQGIQQPGQHERHPELIERFEAAEGRRPRIMVAKMGQDGHDRGAKVVATAYADMGFDVDIGPLFQTPEETAKQAVENDVHVVAMSSLAAGHKTLLPAVDRGVQETRPRGHHGRLRRRHPRPGLRLPLSERRRRHLRPRHRHPGLRKQNPPTSGRYL
jgi:methylmalonyl-CoA mutase